MTDGTVVARTLEGAAAATLIALAARRAGSLRASGTVAAAIVGTVAVAAGWAWGALLIVYFVLASALSRLGGDAKAARTAAIVAKGGARDATQVLANGGAFAVAALATLLGGPSPLWAGLGIGALAASSADTWGTEIGTLVGGPPRTLVGWRRVPAGTSGGVTAWGSIASLAGALFVGGMARLLGWSIPIAAAAVAGGVAGALADSLLGATVQQRRWCERCNEGTEHVEHGCGARTVHRGGLRWLENDRVNLFASLVGAIVGGALAWNYAHPPAA